MGRILTEKDVEAAVKGGSVYAAGGGGWADHGRMLGYAAVSIGKPELVSVDELDADDWVATAAAIGAPASTTPWEMRGVDYVKAVQLLQEALGEKLSGLIIGQNGKSSTLNGWLPSAILGTKVVDAVGDIRAHPTGDMGSIGLAGSPEPMIQTAVGGNRDENRYIELVVRGATGQGLADPAHRLRHVRRFHRLAAAIRSARPTCKAQCGARRHLAGAGARRGDHRGGSQGRQRGDRRDRQDDQWRDPCRRHDHRQVGHLHQGGLRHRHGDAGEGALTQRYCT